MSVASVHISRTLWWERGGKARFGSPKGGKGRNVQLSARAVGALRRHRIHQHEKRLAAGEAWMHTDLLFTNPIGEPMRRDTVFRQSFRPLLERAGLPPSTRLHDLRHTAATLLLQQGVHPRYVQELLGHSSISMTLDTYSHVLPNMGGVVANAMDEALGL